MKYTYTHVEDYIHALYESIGIYHPRQLDIETVSSRLGLNVQYFYTPSATLGTTIILDDRLPYHLFRHTHVSMLAEAGVDLQTIQNRIGHKDGDITRDVYMHVTRKMQKRAADSLGFHFDSILQNAISGEM